MGDDSHLNDILRRVENPYRRNVIWIGHLALALIVSFLAQLLIQMLVPFSSLGQAAATAIGFSVLWFVVLMLHLGVVISLNRRDKAVLHTLKAMRYDISQNPKAKRDSGREVDSYPTHLSDEGELIYVDEYEADEESRLYHD